MTSQVEYRWTFIDELERKVLLLNELDICYYYLRRTPGGFSASKANNRIDNFKRGVSYKGSPAWAYKEKEIVRFADDVCSLLAQPAFSQLISRFGDVTLVPMPTSIPKHEALHDYRLFDLCTAVAEKNGRVRVEDPFDVKTHLRAAHLGGTRDIPTIKANLMFSGFREKPGLVILVDDVITTGSHYIACRDTIWSAYSDVPIIGVFLSIHRSSAIDYEAVGIER